MTIKNLKSYLFDNLSTKQTIFKNTLWLFLAKGTGILMMILVIFSARILGATEFGKFSFALSFVSLFVIFYSFGLPGIIIREFAREKDKKEDFFSILSLQFLFTLVALVLMILGSLFITSDTYIREMIFILSAWSVINGFVMIFFAFFQAEQKMEYQALFMALQYILVFGFGLFALFVAPSGRNLSYVYFFSALIPLISMVFFFHYNLFSLKIKWNFSVWKKFLIMSWPLALAMVFSTIYQYIDSVMLGFAHMMTETGWYNAAGRVVMVSLVPMGLISNSFYPALSQVSKTAKEKFQRILDLYVEIMIILAVSIVSGGLFFASKIINFAYGASFNPSILAFQILILTAGLTFLYVPFYDAMVALDQQKKMFWITLGGAFVNIVLNLFLIPKYSLYGSAVATLATGILLLFVVVVFMKKFTFIKFPIARSFLAFFASIVPILLMYYIAKHLSSINIFILGAIAGVAYFIPFFLIRKYILIKYFKQVYL